MRIAYASDRPADLWVAAAWTALTVAAVAAGVSGPVRVALALPTVLLWPGYALVAALFPERFRLDTAPGADGEAEEVRQGIDGLERFALSLGLSIAVVPLLGLALNFSPWGIRLAPILVALSAFIAAALVVAHRRRSRLPPEDRFVVRVAVETPAWSGLSGVDKALTIGLVVAIVAAAGALAYVLTVPRPGERFTEFYILGPGGKAADYPSALSPDENGTVLVGVVNHEGALVRYDVMVTLAKYADQPNATVDPNATAPQGTTIHEYVVDIGDEANDTRPLVFSAPSRGLWRVGLELRRPTDADAYRSLHLWVRVS